MQGNTPETLAQRIQSGEKNLLPDLWESIRRFVYQQAHKWCAAWSIQRPGLEPDDLAHAGFVKIVENISAYDPDKASFIHWLKYPLMTAFSEEVGCRTPAQLKRPENNAESLSSLMIEDLTLGDMLEDPAAAEALENVENDVYHKQLSDALEKALHDLPEKQEIVLRGKYLRGLSIKDIASEMGRGTSGLKSYEQRGLWKLRENEDLRELHHGSRDPYRNMNLYRHTNLRAWLADGYSVEEYALIIGNRR